MTITRMNVFIRDYDADDTVPGLHYKSFFEDDIAGTNNRVRVLITADRDVLALIQKTEMWLRAHQWLEESRGLTWEIVANGSALKSSSITFREKEGR